MRSRIFGETGRGSTILLAVVLAIGIALAGWKTASARAAAAAAAHQPEPIEVITTAVAQQEPHRATTTSIGTVLALRSITLRTELAGTVSEVALVPGRIVDSGTVLVALDISVERADLQAQQAQAALAQTSLARLERLLQHGAVSAEEVDRARAERDIAQAQIARTEAIIAKKTIRAPFRARVGIADVHPGQYLNDGTQLTTLQGVDGAAHVDFAVAQQVAAGLRAGEPVQVLTGADSTAITARIVAVDARVDPVTRTTTVRATIVGATPAPGSSVRVLVPMGPVVNAIVIPVSALRRGPAGDHVFVVSPDESGKMRAHERPVHSGAMLGDEIVILDGLQAGEQVAASGSFKLRESVLVAVGAAAGGGAQ
ncbi:MAG TPA: efflux RND transporter periplasmic adaptor subunit [Gemmatimonadales bacterium]|nr:efflux RND transporter periplasmic adaptor subunit [Gemmatimonadales bacterium]